MSESTHDRWRARCYNLPLAVLSCWQGSFDTKHLPVAGLPFQLVGTTQAVASATKPNREAGARARKKSPRLSRLTIAGLCNKSGNTYSRTFGTTIGSESLTTVFGMGTGVTFQIWSPERDRRRVQ